jgi:hypothetical protein
MDEVTYFKLPPKCSYASDSGTRVTITSFGMRETDGADEEIAAKRAEGDGGKVTHLEHLVMLSITEVNGVPINVGGKPYTATFNRWNSRARQFAVKAYNSMNAITQEEGEAFLSNASAEPVEE